MAVTSSRALDASIVLKLQAENFERLERKGWKTSRYRSTRMESFQCRVESVSVLKGCRTATARSLCKTEDALRGAASHHRGSAAAQYLERLAPTQQGGSESRQCRLGADSCRFMGKFGVFKTIARSWRLGLFSRPL